MDSGTYTGLSYTTDGGKTIKKVDGVTRCDVVGFGKAKDGEDYLAVYITGEVDGFMQFTVQTTWARTG